MNTIQKDTQKYEFNLENYYRNCKNNREEIRAFIDGTTRKGYSTNWAVKAIASLKAAGCPQVLLIELTKKYCKKTGAEYNHFSSILFGSSGNQKHTTAGNNKPKNIKQETKLTAIPLLETLEKTTVYYNNFVLTLAEKELIANKIINAIKKHNCYHFDYSDGETLMPIE
jgi:predicted metal-binding protein